MKLTEVRHIDADYVSLAVPLKDYARRFGEYRRKAQRRHGKGSGPDLAWKLAANSTYGVLACRHLVTNNVVAANVITGTARAEASAMILALNGLQVITDGCTYRRDQIPACTFAECLRIQPDFSLLRAERDSRIPFHDPATVPMDDGEFTVWYRTHALAFFGVKGKQYKEFFGIHNLVHKKTGDADAFDALATDGVGNYMKCTKTDDGGWKVDEMKMRGYGPDSKNALKNWLVETYSSGRLTSLLPITEDEVLLTLKEARRNDRLALKQGIPEVALPLGLPRRKVGVYKSIKLSAFVCQTPQQYRTLARQVKKFQDRTSCGLELLAMRRSYGDRHERSLQTLAAELNEYIQSGHRDLTGRFHLNRLSAHQSEVSMSRKAQIDQLRAAAEKDLFAMIDTRNLDEHAVPSAILFTAADLHRLE